MTRRGGLLQFSDCLVKNLAQLCPVAVVTAKNAEHSEADWDQNTIAKFVLDMGEGKKVLLRNYSVSTHGKPYPKR